MTRGFRVLRGLRPVDRRISVCTIPGPLQCPNKHKWIILAVTGFGRPAEEAEHLPGYRTLVRLPPARCRRDGMRQRRAPP